MASKPRSKTVQLSDGLELRGGYTLKGLLGEGGFAQAWEAESKDGRQMALKFIPCRNDLSAAKEVRSIQAIRQLAHPNLITVDQVWIDLGYIVVAMELADGSLQDLYHKYQEAAGTPILPELVCEYLFQAAEGLDFLNAHQHMIQGQRQGFQHCDIKPSNILLIGDQVKISDFGLSSATTSTVKSHRRAGTLIYAASEVFQGRLTDWTDQYSLALTYCLLRGGRLPFTDTPTSFRQNYLRPAPDLTMLSEPEQPIIARALGQIPQNRWPTCAEMMERLAGAIA
jgi:serine/threonine protein kinase